MNKRIEFCVKWMSPIGEITISSDGSFLTGLWFKDQKYYGAGRALIEKEVPVLRQAAEWLNDYFSGKRPDPSQLPIKTSGTSMQELVWELLLDIPYGTTTTYGDLAQKVAKRKGIPRMSAQAIGSAVGRNPISIIIPCHRVIAKNGALTGYAGGIEKKDFLLHFEENDKL